MGMPMWPVIAVTAVLAACGATPAPTPSPAATPSPASSPVPSPTPFASPSPQASPTPVAAVPRCHTADLEEVIASDSGAAGHIGLDFELRNRSAQACTVFGYFGLSLLNSEGKVAIAGSRSTHIFVASTGPPQSVMMPPGSAALPTTTATGSPASVTAGHAHFAADYSDVCDNAPNGTGNAWQLFPPDETQPTSVLTGGGQNITVCGLELTPVQATPPKP